METMMREIIINGTGTYNDLGALFAKDQEEYPEINDVIGTVPYSGVEYNFTSVYGNKVYSYRDVTYWFKLWHPDKDVLEQRIVKFADFMYNLPDECDIYDSSSNFHFNGRLVSFARESTVGEEFGARMFACKFRCKTKKIPNTNYMIPFDATNWPDLNDDGAADAKDAAIILTAAANIGAGNPSGLTPEQERRADANRDGEINASDAAIVLSFGAQSGAGNYENSVEGWYKFLNDRLGYSIEVI